MVVDPGIEEPPMRPNEEFASSPGKMNGNFQYQHPPYGTNDFSNQRNPGPSEIGLDFSLPKSRRSKVADVPPSRSNSDDTSRERPLNWRCNGNSSIHSQYEPNTFSPRDEDQKIRNFSSSSGSTSFRDYSEPSTSSRREIFRPFEDPPRPGYRPPPPSSKPHHYDEYLQNTQYMLAERMQRQKPVKPKPRSSRQFAFQEEMHAHKNRPLSMPPPVAGALRPEEKGKRKSKAATSEKIPKKKAKKSATKIDASKAVVSWRWKTITNTHHERLVDLIKLKPGEEDEFEAESAGSRLQAEHSGRKGKKASRSSSRGSPPERLSTLRANIDEERGGFSKPPEDAMSGLPNVRIVAKLRPTSAPEERYRRPAVGSADSEILEQYYNAKKRILTTLKRAKPLSLMRSPDTTTKLSAVLSLKTEKPEGEREEPTPSQPASEWGHAAFIPPGRSSKRQKIEDSGSVYGEEGYPQSLHSVSSTPSRADSDWPYSDVEADESRKKILSQLQKLNDKRARLEAQLTRIQKGQSIATKLPDAPVFRADTLLSAHQELRNQAKSSDKKRKELHYSSVAPHRKIAPEPVFSQPVVIKTPDDVFKDQWKVMCLKFIPLAYRVRCSRQEKASARRAKIGAACLRDYAKVRLDSSRLAQEFVQRAKFMVRDMFSRWKVLDKEEKKWKKLKEKEEVEEKRVALEMQEARRQQRKLNFLITQTELYAHFMGRKIQGTNDSDTTADKAILQRLDEEAPLPENLQQHLLPEPDVTESLVGEKAKLDAVRNVAEAVEMNKKRITNFNKNSGVASELNGQAQFDTEDESKVLTEPTMFGGTLKVYQKRGISWLASLFSNGINGILADEMGLGKTVQSIAFLAHVAEEHKIWGPFLIVAPASTLHNWQQEFHRFVPKFKAVPYWGTTEERKILRQFWKVDKMHTEQASFHVVITSYQLVVQDAPYLKKINWQYMILDEAQAIKSSASIRWKLLLDFPCRNRLLLTGTPIQNSMAELWSLLHFIMPSLFDNHTEFNEWFSRDIESHAENKSQMDDKHLSRLHMILKPFMMRRIKRDVENELSDKIEIMVNCPLTKRQQDLYEALKHKISIDDLLYSSTSTSAQSETTSSLMNLVMHFRKVCNHPELFERRDTRSPVWLPALSYNFPKTAYKECSQESLPESSKRYLINKYFMLSSSANVRAAADEARLENRDISSVMSFCRFTPVSEVDVQKVFSEEVYQRLKLRSTLNSYRLRHGLELKWWEPRQTYNRSMLLLEPTFPCSEENVLLSSLKNFVICDIGTQRYSYGPCRIFASEKQEKRNEAAGGENRHRKLSELNSSRAGNQETPECRKQQVLDMYPFFLPAFFHCAVPKVSGRAVTEYVYDRKAESENLFLNLCNAEVKHRKLLWNGPDYVELPYDQRGNLRQEEKGGILGLRAGGGWFPMDVPDKQHLIVDSGKLRVLDSLLRRLKEEGHRVLIYSLMTKMMDILEEFMVHKHYAYMRLDGSSKISDRRDMVNDFQSREEIFVFLLSTRAGGLGINLTAADTVIFYDSDWNPTVDQQAMDRAHRLGQTKQVTVYRLICRNTVEERILERAQEKSAIQRMVISGGDYRPEILKPTEVVSLLLDDDDIKKNLYRRESELKQRELPGKKTASKKQHSTTKKTIKPKAKSNAGATVSPLAQSTNDIISKTSKSKKKPASTAGGVSSQNTSDMPTPVIKAKRQPAKSSKAGAKKIVEQASENSSVGMAEEPKSIVVPNGTQVKAGRQNKTNGTTSERKSKKRKGDALTFDALDSSSTPPVGNEVARGAQIPISSPSAEPEDVILSTSCSNPFKTPARDTSTGPTRKILKTKR